MGGPRDYSASTRAALAMLSRARCYYPGCATSIMRFIDGEPYIDYQIAHVRDARPGNRYVKEMTDEQRASFANLILLCKPHHELIDKRHPDRYSIEDLEGWKRSREGDAIEVLAQVGPVTEGSLAGLLTESVTDAQERATAVLRDQEDAARRRVEAVRGEITFTRVHDAFAAASEVGLLSPLGVRAAAPLTDFYVRIQQRENRLIVHLDTRWDASVFSEIWMEGQPFSDVIVALGAQVRPTSYWTGAHGWELGSAVEAMVDVLVAGLNLKERGGWVNNAVQLVGSGWLLSDFEAMGIERQYQVTYRRLDEVDWYTHLANKPWTNRSEVAEMLDHAAFLGQLATDGVSGLQSHEALPSDNHESDLGNRPDEP